MGVAVAAWQWQVGSGGCGGSAAKAISLAACWQLGGAMGSTVATMRLRQGGSMATEAVEVQWRRRQRGSSGSSVAAAWQQCGGSK